MSTYSVKKPITVLMGILIVIVLGLFAVTKLPLTLFPDINLPFVVTITSYEGKSPEELEQEVSTKIESGVATIGQFQEIESMSYEHFAISVITFSESANMDSVIIELRETLNNISFADGVTSPRIMRISPDMLPVLTLTLSRVYETEMTDNEELIANTEWITKDIMTELTSIPGVADVSISGAADIILEVVLDQTIIASYGLSNEDVLEIIEEQNVGGLIGVALDSGELRMLYLGDKPSTIEDIKGLPIYNDGGDIITLSELAVTDGIVYVNADTQSYSKINGKQGIQISFQKESDYSIVDVTNNIINRLDKIVAEDTNNATYDVLLNQGEYINLAVGSVLQNLIYGAILAILVLLLFLRDIKPTLIVGLAIPISVIAAFMLMYFTGVSLNMVSMGGLALGIGMLVDNSIVVIENIYRMIGEGKSKTEAAIAGSKQVAGAITASTLTTVAVFVPIAFIEGMVADIFISMALTIAYSLGASLVIALTLVPSMASRMLNDKQEKKETKGFTRIKSVYKKTILWALKYKILTISILLLLLAGSIAGVKLKGFIMLPTTDEGTIGVSINTTNEATFLEKAEYTDYISELLLDNLTDIETVSASISNGSSFGMRSMMLGETGSISLTINLEDARSKTTIEAVNDIENILENIDFTLLDITKEDILGFSVSAQNNTAAMAGAQGVNIKVSGYDLETIENISNDLTQILTNIDGLEKIDNGISQGSDNVKININNEIAMTYGLTNQDVLDSIEYLYTGLETLGGANELTLTIEGTDYTLSIPANSLGAEMSYDAFGDYINFLGGIVLFDEETKEMIDTFIQNSGMGIYTIPYPITQPLQFVINPYLKINGSNELYFDTTFISPDETLASRSLAPLFTSNLETSVAEVTLVSGFTTINTDGTNRFVNVTAGISSDENVTIVSKEVTNKVQEYIDGSTFASYGNGYLVELKGENEEIQLAMGDMIIAALVAILLVYMVMAIQFQSLKYPLIILGTIPLAFTGGLLALLITNVYLSIVALMGLIILVGIIVNNGIVLIDYINKLREQGKGVLESIIEAGQTRIRPIFMTALTTILALVTMAIGVGQGSELLQPMAITAIGGLLYGTVLTLIIVPVIYALVNHKNIKQEETNDAVN